MVRRNVAVGVCFAAAGPPLRRRRSLPACEKQERMPSADDEVPVDGSSLAVASTNNMILEKVLHAADDEADVKTQTQAMDVDGGLVEDSSESSSSELKFFLLSQKHVAPPCCGA